MKRLLPDDFVGAQQKRASATARAAGDLTQCLLRVGSGCWCQYPLSPGNPAMSFWIRCYTSTTRKCFAHLVAGVLLGIGVFMAPMPHALAQKVPTDTGILGSPDGPAYPLKASGNNRFLVDQNNTPFLMVGDSPQHLISNLSQKEAAEFMANRRDYGINTLWINLLCIFTDA